MLGLAALVGMPLLVQLIVLIFNPGSGASFNVFAENCSRLGMCAMRPSRCQVQPWKGQLMLRASKRPQPDASRVPRWRELLT